MAVTVNLDLYVDSSETPAYYWLDVSVPAEAGLEMVDHGGVPIGPFTGDTMHLDVNAQGFNDGERTITVHIGGTSLDEEDGEIHVHVLNESNTEVGDKKIRMEQAHEQTKPIPKVV